MIKIVDFNNSCVQEAADLARMNYEEERFHAAPLPVTDVLADLTWFAKNGMGVAAYEGGKMAGFLCGCPPFENVFGSTKVKGVFSPMGANGTLKENRLKIFAAMYQEAGAGWVEAGAVSHGVCLYAHDHDAQRQFFRYGFGLRCMDGIRFMDLIDCVPSRGYEFQELAPGDYPSVYPLDLMLNQHQCTSPYFVCRKAETRESFAQQCSSENSRYFVAKQEDKICAFVKISDTGETCIAEGAGYRHINGAYCLAEHRGKGLYQNLLNFVISILKEEGFQRLGVDFESFNPTAYGFWMKYFVPYTCSVVRRIDENILGKI